MSKSKFQFLEDNPILDRSGVYGLFNTITAQWYIGYSKSLPRRVNEHSRYQGNAGWKLEKAVKDFGIRNFIATPLYYSLDPNDLEHLLEVETQLIKIFDSINNGYNLISKTSKYLYGPEHASAISKAILDNPERYTRRKKINKDRANQSEVKAAFGLRVSKAWEDPKFRAMRSRALSEMITGRTYITNGVENTSIPPNSEIPEGWRQGRSYSVKPKGGDGKHTKGTVWVTNGILNDRFVPFWPLPEGWRYGRSSGFEAGLKAAVTANTKHLRIPTRPRTQGWHRV